MQRLPWGTKKVAVGDRLSLFRGHQCKKYGGCYSDVVIFSEVVISSGLTVLVKRTSFMKHLSHDSVAEIRCSWKKFLENGEFCSRYRHGLRLAKAKRVVTADFEKHDSNRSRDAKTILRFCQ